MKKPIFISLASFITTFIVVTHDRTVAEKTDRIIEIRDGRIIKDEPALP